jgi:hypothetical protein
MCPYIVSMGRRAEIRLVFLLTSATKAKENFMNNGKTAADHRTSANKYRQTPWPEIAQPPKAEAAQPGAEFPKAVKCFDGATRVAHNAEHEKALTAEPVQTGLADPLEAPSPQTEPVQTGAE